MSDVIIRIQDALAKQNFGGLIVSSPDNVAYVAGFEVPSQVIPVSRHRLVFCVITPSGGEIMLVPDMEASLARSNSELDDVRDYNEFTENPILLLADTIRSLGILEDRIAIEDDFIPGIYLNRLFSELPDTNFLPARAFMSDMRSIKTPLEIQKLRKVGSIAEKAHFQAAAKTREGMTELEMASLLYESIFSQGGEKINHLVIGSGERSEHGNANPTAKQLNLGDLVRVDIFAKIGGYQSDVARTAVVGEPTARQREIWTKLIEARHLVLDMIKPGVRTGEIYRAYASYFEKVGLTPINFVGHGLGITLHEEPYISRYHDGELLPGMVLAIEPLYLKSGEGYQIEDEVIVTEESYELITNFQDPSQLILIEPK